eukprot:gene29701-36792_t
MKEFTKNGIYYMMGVFKEYFESGRYADTSLRDSIRRIIPTDCRNFEANHCVPELPTQMRLTLAGLQEVRQTVPEALFYGSLTQYEDRTVASDLSNEEGVEMELTILTALDYDVLKPTGYHLVDRYLNVIQASTRTRDLAAQYTKRNLQENVFVQVPMHKFAAAV